jgi:hypothetical protein
MDRDSKRKMDNTRVALEAEKKKRKERKEQKRKQRDQTAIDGKRARSAPPPQTLECLHGNPPRTWLMTGAATATQRLSLKSRIRQPTYGFLPQRLLRPIQLDLEEEKKSRTSEEWKCP